ncbi:IclR family transcriptional regulator [Comamonas serinivorans]|uniref:IclR family transcriptional regulator n=1 Tax=Comamonas serinivorans TaxID=1082851 RepID=A0A1Y0EMM0_9BURK|nr:helix-turn-helix domain-containing protein [Comamonas serinivorans]ARU04846.1 IclR family transcriptional regulator [Comamonas serinivorans]
MTPETDNDNRLVSALVRGMSILQCFDTQRLELSAKELMDLTGLPKPTLFRLVDTLCEIGALRYSERVSKYVPGLTLLNLSAPVLARMSVRQFARPAMQELADHIEAQLQLIVASQMRLTYVDVVQGRGSKVYRPEVGTHVSMSRTASGRAFLLSLPEDQREAYLSQLAEREPEKASFLRRRLDEARQDLTQHGFTRSHADLHREVQSICVPMQATRDGELWLFTASMPVFSPHLKDLDTEVGPRLITLVHNVESSLGNS